MTDLEEDKVKWAVNNLRQQSLVRAIQRADSRVMKYEHLLTEKLNVDGAELAALCVLMLRGPQTVGEIKGRTGRLHEFASVADVAWFHVESERSGYVVVVDGGKSASASRPSKQSSAPKPGPTLAVRAKGTTITAKIAPARTPEEARTIAATLFG